MTLFDVTLQNKTRTSTIGKDLAIQQQQQQQQQTVSLSPETYQGAMLC